MGKLGHGLGFPLTFQSHHFLSGEEEQIALFANSVPDGYCVPSLRRYTGRLPLTLLAQLCTAVLFGQPKVWMLFWSMLAEAPAITSNDFNVVAYVGT